MPTALSTITWPAEVVFLRAHMQAALQRCWDEIKAKRYFEPEVYTDDDGYIYVDLPPRVERYFVVNLVIDPKNPVADALINGAG